MVKPVAETGLVVKDDTNEISTLIESKIMDIRPEMQNNPYIQEALRVLPVHGYRSAIGSIWNAAIDDLRNKVMFRSLLLFNKEMSKRIGKECRTYEDFQESVNDDVLIEGAYKIGVIGWEAQKVLKHSKETRHIFDGHPKSTEPSIIKVLAMLEDCTKYVLKEDYPLQIIDIDEYIATMGTTTYDRNTIGIENSLGELPDIYKNELVNKLFSAYIDLGGSSTLRSNIEFCAPFLWRFLVEGTKHQIARRVDTEIQRGNTEQINYAFQYLEIVNGQNYLSLTARKYKIEPLIIQLENNPDNWVVENENVKQLARYADIIPSNFLVRYVNCLTQTYVGYTGSSIQFSRTDFYANGAAYYIPSLFEKFDDTAADAFLDSIRKNKSLQSRISNPIKLRRLRLLGNIVISKVSANYHDKKILEKLNDENGEEKFLKMLKKKVT
jgi:hypothetical protein